jgi:hypothetical protein
MGNFLVQSIFRVEMADEEEENEDIRRATVLPLLFRIHSNEHENVSVINVVFRHWLATRQCP